MRWAHIQLLVALMETKFVWAAVILGWSWFFWIPGFVVSKNYKNLEKPMVTYLLCVVFCLLTFLILVKVDFLLVEYLEAWFQDKCLIYTEENKAICGKLFSLQRYSWVAIWPISILLGLVFSVMYMRKKSTNKNSKNGRLRRHLN